ncbi:aminoglycoside phosphotransferase family protein [Streptomyces sp. HGB0020]|uniref:aminoglycoside phosphotransferase family protein n=1 Tax=Streptomyces sp. HGB0020 TaxID=1078086 RepID=UPI00034E22CA|nr:aminoglycoside phosphotransferase family protein [Streptomyces sp. HGB0020]EPD57159.1 hypothetical protein HMPREF1211_06889 [Streptomyces sp. HGB0020]
MRFAVETGQASNGYHNQNYVLQLTDSMARLLGRQAGSFVTVRIRRIEAPPVVIRTWQDEAEILGAIYGVLPHVPQCLVRRDSYAIHSYVDGVPLSSVCGNGKPVDSMLVKALAELLAQMTRVSVTMLPPLPAGWPRNGEDSNEFLRTLSHRADQQIARPNWPAYGCLLAALGVPDDALVRFAQRTPSMTRRPLSLLHGDLHRDNLIMSYSGNPPLICVDWELATYGDPLYDLSTHLVRMQYPSHQWDEVVDAWAQAMQQVCPAATNGLTSDLRHYIAFERAQSVYPDVIRAALLVESSTDPKSLHEATARVQQAMEAAAEPLGLTSVPTLDKVEQILTQWRTQRNRNAKRSAVTMEDRSWQADHRVSEHPDFPRSLVPAALLAEDVAPAHRIFQGVRHRATVVSLAGVESPVVVRRSLPEARSPEYTFLSEHSVLGALEESGVAVSAPKILVSGWNYEGGRFAIHSYAGPFDPFRPPEHPVNGLLPHEADSLVDQLCALTQVDHHCLDPGAGHGHYYKFVTEQLVSLVRRLPTRSQHLARILGLPGADLLRVILARHRMSPRAPVLLHGDLNPWNLVRHRDASGGLTIIDWEMAVVGDALHDLVRHMHLTPTRPEIRDRMFRRWERRLSSEYTWNWARDWKVYRRIEIVRSAYVDLDRLVTGASLEAPNVLRAVDSYAKTLLAATAALGLRSRPTANPHLDRALGSATPS